MKSLYRRLVLPVLAVSLTLTACSDSNEEPAEEGHTPASARLFIADTDTELTPDIALVAGATTRVEVRFYHDDGDLIDIPAGHQTKITFANGAFATVASVAGEVLQRDVTVNAAAAATTTVTVGYGHDADADELSFGPFDVTAVAPPPVARR